MNSLSDLLKGTLLSLKQIKDLLVAIITKVDNIDLTPITQHVDDAKTEIVDTLQGSDDEADLSTIKTQQDNLLLEVEDVKEDIGDLDEILTAINGDTVDEIVNAYIGEQIVLIDDMIGDWSSSDDSDN